MGYKLNFKKRDSPKINITEKIYSRIKKIARFVRGKIDNSLAQKRKRD